MQAFGRGRESCVVCETCCSILNEAAVTFTKDANFIAAKRVLVQAGALADLRANEAAQAAPPLTTTIAHTSERAVGFLNLWMWQ